MKEEVPLQQLILTLSLALNLPLLVPAVGVALYIIFGKKFSPKSLWPTASSHSLAPPLPAEIEPGN